MSESRAKKERKAKQLEVVSKKKNIKGIIFNIAVVLVIAAVAGVGGYAAHNKIAADKAVSQETDDTQSQVQTVEDVAAEEGLTVEELLAKIGLEDLDLTADSSADELLEAMTVESFAKFEDTDVEDFKKQYGIEQLDNNMSWSEAQMSIPMGKIAEEQYGVSFAEFAAQNELPEEITADMTQAEAVAVLQAQQEE